MPHRRTPGGLALATVLLASLGSGCGASKILRLENELLKTQNAELRAELGSCEADAPPPDFATTVSIDVVAEYMLRAGYTGVEPSGPNMLLVGVSGRNTAFRLSVQLFEREKVLFLAVGDYLQLEDATTSSAMVLLLTQLVTTNYELLLGKFQLNPSTGEISLSVEINLDDGLGFRTFRAVADHLVRTADRRYPELVRAAAGNGM